MGHDIHFLSRLERVSLPQVELAMSLYNDTPLLKFILSKVSLPDAAERVAISLADPEKGPFLVVARSGHFVTCLGEGMLPGELPIITRSQLDALADQVAELRARISVAEQLVGKHGNVNKLHQRIFKAGAALSREEFIGISAWQPLLRGYFLKQALEGAERLSTTRVLLRKMGSQPKQHEVPVLRDYWNTLWAVGHLMLLFGMDARDFFENGRELADQQASLISWSAVRQGLVPVSIRGAWTAGKIGKLILAGYKSALDEPSTALRVTNAVYGLMAIAARHSRLRGEIRKALHAARPDSKNALEELNTGIVRVAAGAFDMVFDHRDELRPFQRKIGGELFLRQWGRFVKAAPRYESPADVPENLALAALANTFGFDLQDVEARLHVLMNLPWLAPAPPEDLYYPAEVVKEVAVPFIPELVVKLLQSHKSYYGPNQPARAKVVPGRNDPCPCGSGNKYKRCCEATG